MLKRTRSTDDRPAEPAEPTFLPAEVVSGPSRFSPRTRKWGTRILLTVGVASTLLWVGAIVFGAVVNPHLAGWLEDRTFPAAAEPICEATVAEVKTYPPAHESPSPAARAAVIRQTTALLQNMLGELRAVVPDTADAKWINMWIDDWGVHLDDRLDFARRLDEKGAKEEFFESTKANTQISKSINGYAETNKMESCGTPGDV